MQQPTAHFCKIFKVYQNYSKVINSKQGESHEISGEKSMKACSHLTTMTLVSLDDYMDSKANIPDNFSKKTKESIYIYTKKINKNIETKKNKFMQNAFKAHVYYWSIIRDSNF